MKKKYLFFDIDGTLTTGTMEGIIPVSTRKTLQELQKNHFVAISTGRPYFMCKDIAKELCIDNIVCNGGNTVYMNGQCLADEPLDKESAIKMLRECDELGYSWCLSYEDKLSYITKNDLIIKKIEIPFIAEHISVVPHLNIEELPQICRMIIAIDKFEEKKLISLGEIVAQRYHESFVMVEPEDKFKGIKVIMEKLNAPFEEIVVFGDGINDIKMFKQAPFSIAVENAIGELKDIADYVTYKSDEDGIKKACEKFGWI